MSILIKGMKMPTCCFYCEMCYQDQDSEHCITSRCAAQKHKEIFPDKSVRDDDCPLVEVPSTDVAEVQHGEWIPVKERLPEEKCKCLVYKKHTRLSALVSFTNDLESIDNYDFQGQKRWGFFYYDSEYGYCESLGVTHWMPLPEPPKEEANG